MAYIRFASLVALLVAACSSTSDSTKHTTAPARPATNASLKLVATASQGSPPQAEVDVDVINMDQTTPITIQSVQVVATPGIRVTALKISNASAPFSGPLLHTAGSLRPATIAPGAVQTLRMGLAIAKQCQGIQHAAPALDIEYTRAGASSSIRVIPQGPPGKRPWLASLICPRH